MAGIGSLYDAGKVVIGQAAGFIAPASTVLPADSITVFDESVWLAQTVSFGGATGGTATYTLSGGPLAAPVVVSGIAFGVTSTAFATAINAALLAAGVTAITANVTGSGTTVAPFKINLAGPGAGEILHTANLASLTGATGQSSTPSPWVPAGATEQGWTVTYNPSTQDHYIEEQQTQIGQEVTTAVLEFTAVLAEDIIRNLQWAFGATTTTVQAPSTPNFGKTSLGLSSGPLPRYAVALEAKNFAGYPRRYYATKMTCAANFSQAFRRAAGKRMVPVTFRSVCNLEEIQAIEITANHL